MSNSKLSRFYEIIRILRKCLSSEMRHGTAAPSDAAPLLAVPRGKVQRVKVKVSH